MWRKVFSWVFIFSIIIAGSGRVFASDADEIAQLKERISVLEQKIKNRSSGSMTTAGVDEELAQIREMFSGLSLGVGATMVYQVTNNANGDSLSKNSEDVGDATYSVDIELTKEFDNGDTAAIILEAGEGSGVDGDLSVYSGVNADATGGDATLAVTEAWYEHGMDSFTVTFGKIAADAFMDANEYANDEATQFLGSEFKHSSTIGFPDNGAGVVLAWEATEELAIETIVIDGDGDWENVFEDVFYGAQVTVMPKLFNRCGNYRFFVWGSEADHIKWSDANQTKEDNYGIGISFDQELTDDLGAFTRYAWQNPDVYADGASESLEHSFSAGLQLAGSSWNRDEDIVGLAFGAVIPSDDYKNSSSSLDADTEKHVELYYSYKVNDHLTISPDLQVIWDPYGGDAVNGDDTVVVAGIRSQIDF